VIVVDSSVWIAHFRNLASRQVVLLRALFGREELLVGDIILLEVLRGARDERNAVRLSRSMHAFDVVPMLGNAIAVQAAWNFRALRAVGVTIHSSPDLIIGTYCIEHRHTLLHDDRDFGPMHEHLGLPVL
jgi:predicted nucleic acid-binding protein